MFHKSCINKWINTSDKNTCPLWGQNLNLFKLIIQQQKKIKIILDTHPLKNTFTKTKVLITNDYKQIMFLKLNLELFQMCPSKWSVHNGLDMLPIYTIYGN